MIKPPSYKKNAVPSPRGWRHPRTGELLKKQKLTQEQIDEYLGVGAVSAGTISAPEPEVFEIEEEVQEIIEDEETVEDLEYEEMSKLELEEIGREHGIELDRREKKSSLIDKLKDAIN